MFSQSNQVPNRPHPGDFANAPQARRILLIGATGQLGWELRQSLQPLGQLITASRVRPVIDETNSWLPVDLASPHSIAQLVRQSRPNLIVNAAAYTAVDRAEQEADHAWAINAVAPGVLAEEANRCGAALVHYSTDYVFDGSGDRPWQETDEPSPLNVYGRTKLAGEQAIVASGAAHLLLRVCWVYGVHGNNFVKTMLRLAVSRPKLSIVDDQVGAPTSARAIADATSQILGQGICQAPADIAGYFRERGGIYHLCCQGEVSWHGFATEIFRLSQTLAPHLPSPALMGIPSGEYPTPAVRPKNSRLDTRCVRHAFGLSLPSWQAALRPCLETLLAAAPAPASSSMPSPAVPASNPAAPLGPTMLPAMHSATA